MLLQHFMVFIALQPRVCSPHVLMYGMYRSYYLLLLIAGNNITQKKVVYNHIYSMSNHACPGRQKYFSHSAPRSLLCRKSQTDDAVCKCRLQHDICPHGKRPQWQPCSDINDAIIDLTWWFYHSCFHCITATKMSNQQFVANPEMLKRFLSCLNRRH